MNTELTALQARLDLTGAEMAAYLGVPRPTWDKWARGEREPPAALHRLLEVLGYVEVLCPALHDQLVNRKG